MQLSAVFLFIALGAPSAFAVMTPPNPASAGAAKCLQFIEAEMLPTSRPGESFQSPEIYREEFSIFQKTKNKSTVNYVLLSNGQFCHSDGRSVPRWIQLKGVARGAAEQCLELPNMNSQGKIHACSCDQLSGQDSLACGDSPGSLNRKDISECKMTDDRKFASHLESYLQETLSHLKKSSVYRSKPELERALRNCQNLSGLNTQASDLISSMIVRTSTATKTQTISPQAPIVFGPSKGPIKEFNINTRSFGRSSPAAN